MSTNSGWTSGHAWSEAYEELALRCPWPGPRPLTGIDADDLVGRRTDLNEFLVRITGSRLIHLTGASGVGKSSFLAAGVVPRLQKEYTFVSCSTWNLRVGQDFATYLAEMLHDSLSPELKGEFHRDTNIFFDLGDRSESAIIVLDQFEEMLRQDSDARDAAIELIYGLLVNFRFKIVLSYRSEFIGQLRDLDLRRQGQWEATHYELLALDDGFGEDLVALPAAKAAVNVDPSLVKKLAEMWRAARQVSTRQEILVGPLHLQAMLVSLWFEARSSDGDVAAITEKHLAGMLERAGLSLSLDQEPARAASAQTEWPKVKAVPGPEREAVRASLLRYRDLMLFALEESAFARLALAQEAAIALDMDRYLVDGVASQLITIAPHLSSGTYKLERQLSELASGMVLRDQVRRVGQAQADPGAATRQVRQLVTALVNDAASRTAVLDQTRAVTLKSLGPLTEGLNLNSVTGLGTGPMAGCTDFGVLLEEVRRFCWAIFWLGTLNLARTKDAEGGDSTVTLIHDGLGPALIRWRENYQRQNGTWTLRSLTAPVGKEHLWGQPRVIEVTEPLYQSELSGRPGDLKYHVNLNLSSNAVLFADVRNAVFVSGDFRGSFIGGARFENVTFLNCLLDGAIFSDCRIVSSTGDAEPVQPPPAADRVQGQPRYVLPAPKLTRRLLRYREVPGETGANLLVPSPGLAARPTELNPGEDGLVAWEPLGQGLLLEGGRVSALTLRGLAFESGASVTFKRIRGAGLDIAEMLRNPSTSVPRYAFTECALRHVSLSDASEEGTSGQAIEVRAVESSLAQWWIGAGLKGSLSVESATLGQFWVASAGVNGSLANVAGTGLIGAAVTDSHRLPVIDAAAVLDVMPGDSLQRFSRVMNVTDYRRDDFLAAGS